MNTKKPFLQWFRDSAPYIHAHRNHTFVVYFSGEAVSSPEFANSIHDFALLNSLGIRLVLVHGIRPQVEQRLLTANEHSLYHQNIRITDHAALQCVKEAAGTIRVELEAMLSMGLSNSPMSGAKLRVASGNFVTAQPIGIREGIDYAYTGEVRRIDSDAIHEKLEQNNIILVSPVGYSPTGETFNLSAENVAAKVAIALDASKLILLTESGIPSDEYGNSIKQLTTLETRQILLSPNDFDADLQRNLYTAVSACESGVSRTHLVCRKTDGALLQELFTHDGIGTLVSSSAFENLRTATLLDVAGILDLITPLEQNGTLVVRSREILEMEISSFTVIDRDGLIIGCAALYSWDNERSGELACIMVHSEYRDESRAETLLNHIQDKAKAQQLLSIFALTTQTTHWFLEHGFEYGTLNDLPSEKQKLYNYRRNSKILVKTL